MQAIHPQAAGPRAERSGAAAVREGRAYHPALVVLHWLLAVMLLFMMGMGGLVLQHLPNASPDKIGALRGHLIGGAATLVLMLVRWVLRWRTLRPPAAAAVRGSASRLGLWMHRALYAAVFAMALSGFALAVTAGIGQVVFGGVGSLPANFDAYAARTVHGIVAWVLLAFVAVHVGAALARHGGRRDGVLRRMTLGRR